VYFITTSQEHKTKQYSKVSWNSDEQPRSKYVVSYPSLDNDNKDDSSSSEEVVRQNNYKHRVQNTLYRGTVSEEESDGMLHLLPIF
jgi:hypothetical protein